MTLASPSPPKNPTRCQLREANVNFAKRTSTSRSERQLREANVVSTWTTQIFLPFESEVINTEFQRYSGAFMLSTMLMPASFRYITRFTKTLNATVSSAAQR